MNEIITRISPIENVKVNQYTNVDGYEIVTDKQRIILGIENGRNCCENWGYFMSEDKVSQFVGATLLDLTITDTALNTQKVDALDMYEGGIMFVNISTDRGVLQFVAYNEHNGYYGHEAVVISEQLNHSEEL